MSDEKKIVERICGEMELALPILQESLENIKTTLEAAVSVMKPLCDQIIKVAQQSAILDEIDRARPVIAGTMRFGFEGLTIIGCATENISELIKTLHIQIVEIYANTFFSKNFEIYYPDAFEEANWNKPIGYIIDATEEVDYTAKQDLVKAFNDICRSYGVAVVSPVSSEPSLLLAINSHDGKGRYTFQSKLTKKRSGSYKTPTEFLPIRLVPDVPRKEGVIERRVIDKAVPPPQQSQS